MPPPQEPIHSAAFVAWAKDQAVPVSIPGTDERFHDLGFLSRIVGGAQVVCLAENARYINFGKRGDWEESTWKHLIADASLIVNRMEQHRLACIQASSHDDYDWALRSAEILRDVGRGEDDRRRDRPPSGIRSLIGRRHL